MDDQVFREVTVEWQGQRKPLVPSIALLRRVKAAGLHTLKLAQDCITGAVDPVDLAVAHSIFLTAAGFPVSEDESYRFVTSGDAGKIADFQLAYVQAVLPGTDIGKKPEAPVPSQPKAVKRKGKT